LICTAQPPEKGVTLVSEGALSSVKRSLGIALRARIWYREFRELTMMCAVYNIKKTAEQEIALSASD